MYSPNGDDARASAPPNARDSTSAIPHEYPAWQREAYKRDVRIDKVERDRVGAGKRSWSADRVTPSTPIQRGFGGAPMLGNGLGPRNKPRFQGRHGGFFFENGQYQPSPSFATPSPGENGLVQKFGNEPLHVGTGAAAVSPSISEVPGFEYRASKIEGRHGREPFLCPGDGRDSSFVTGQPVHPEQPPGFSGSDKPPWDGERAKVASGGVNWELIQRAEKEHDNLHDNTDLHRRGRVANSKLDVGRDWSHCNKKLEGSRLDRYGSSSRETAIVDSQGTKKESSTTHGWWSRDRGGSATSARNCDLFAGKWSVNEFGNRTPGVQTVVACPAGTTVNETVREHGDQPSPSKRPRLGWGQGLAKYENKVGDTDESVASLGESDRKRGGQTDESPASVTQSEEKNVDNMDEILSLNYVPAATPVTTLQVDGRLYQDLYVQDKTPCSSVPCSPHKPSVLSPTSPLKATDSIPSSTRVCRALDRDLNVTSHAQLLLESDRSAQEAVARLHPLEGKDIPKALGCSNLEPSSSKVSEEGIVPQVSGVTSLELNEEAPLPELFTSKKVVCKESIAISEEVVLGADLAGWTEQLLYRTVQRLESEIDLVRKEIANLEVEEISSFLSECGGLVTSPVLHVVVPAKQFSFSVEKPVGGSVEMDEDPQGTVLATGDGMEESSSSLQTPPTALCNRLEELRASGATGTIPLDAMTGNLDDQLGNLSVTTVENMCMPERGELELEVKKEEPEAGGPGMEVDLKNVVPGITSKCETESSYACTRASEPASSSDSEFSEPNLESDEETEARGRLILENLQGLVESLILENHKKAQKSVDPFMHLLPQEHAQEVCPSSYQSPSPAEAPVWQQNLVSHNKICDRLTEKLVERRHCHKFKERVLTLRFQALKEAWRREQEEPCDRRDRIKSAPRLDIAHRISLGPSSQRTSLRSRLLQTSGGRLDVASDAVQVMKKLMSELPVEPLRSVLKMPSMILDEKERNCRRFVNRNALVEDPICLEMERKRINPWSPEEKKIFIESFALHHKNFRKISSYLEHKTTADCVEYYYRNQKSEDFEKTQRRQQLKKRRDCSRTSNSYLASSIPSSSRNREATAVRLEALNLAALNTRPARNNIHLKVVEFSKPTMSSSDLSLPSSSEAVFKNSSRKDPKITASNLLELAIPAEPIVDAVTSGLVLTPCSVSSTGTASTELYRPRNSAKNASATGPLTSIDHSEQHAAGLKGTRSMQLRRISPRSFGEEMESQWTDGERELFTNAVATSGKDFRSIALHVGSKNQTQCKAFFSKTRKRLGLDLLVEQFHATWHDNAEAAMLVQSLRHNRDPVLRMKQTDADVKVEVDSEQVEAIADLSGKAKVSSDDKLIETVTAVSTLQSLAKESKSLAAGLLSDLSLVAEAAAVLEKSASMKQETPVVLESAAIEYFTGEEVTTVSEPADANAKLDRVDIAQGNTIQEEEEDSEATKSDDDSQASPNNESDTVVDQAAAALVGISSMFTDKEDARRKKCSIKLNPRSSPVNVFARKYSARLPLEIPSMCALAGPKSTMTLPRSVLQTKEKSCTAFSSDSNLRHKHMPEMSMGRKAREVTAGEAKPRREPTSWTVEEKGLFADILGKHGKDWVLLQKSLPSKSLTQIKTYFQNSKARSRFPATERTVNAAGRGAGGRKRKVEEFETTSKQSNMAVRLKQKPNGTAPPPDSVSTQRFSPSAGSLPSIGNPTGTTKMVNASAGSSFGTEALMDAGSVCKSGNPPGGVPPGTVDPTTSVGADILAYTGLFGYSAGQPIDQDNLSMGEIQDLIRQLVSANGFAQASTQVGAAVSLPGARPAFPLAGNPRLLYRSPQPQLAASAPSKSSHMGIQHLRPASPSVVQQTGQPEIHQVALQMQEMIAQQQQLQIQLTNIIQQQAAEDQQPAPHPPLHVVQPLEKKMLEQQQHLQQQLATLIQQQALQQQQQHVQQQQEVTHPPLQVVRPLEQKLQQVVEQLQQQQEQQEHAQSLVAQAHGQIHLQCQPPVLPRGILKLIPRQGALTLSQPDISQTQSSVSIHRQLSFQLREHQHQEQQQGHFMVTRESIRVSPTSSQQEPFGHQTEVVDLEDTDSDVDHEGAFGVVSRATQQQMAVMPLLSSEQQKSGIQGSNSSLPSDSHQVRPWDVKLFGQSLLCQPPAKAVPPNEPPVPGVNLQQSLYPIPSVGATAGTLSKGFVKDSDSLASAFGRVGAASIMQEGQHATWQTTAVQSVSIGNVGLWSNLQESRDTKETDLGLLSAQQSALHVTQESISEHSDGGQPSIAPEELRRCDSLVDVGQVLDPSCGSANDECNPLEMNQADSARRGGVTEGPTTHSFPTSSNSFSPHPLGRNNSLHTILKGHEQWG